MEYSGDTNFAPVLLFFALILFVVLCGLINWRVRLWNGRYDHTVGPHRITGDTYEPPAHVHSIDALRSPMWQKDGVLFARCSVQGCKFTTQIGSGLPTPSLQEDGELR